MSQTISQINQSFPVTLRLLIPVAARWTSRARHGTAPILPVSVDKQPVYPASVRIRDARGCEEVQYTIKREIQHPGRGVHGN